jgi:hypothetical protein
LATAIGLRTALISGAAVARVADEPPGSAFQDRGYRDYLGFSPFGRPHRTARAERGVHEAYAQVPLRTLAHRHKSVGRKYNR